MNRGERRGSWGEGWLIAAALALVLALSFGVYIARIPPKVTAIPVHAADYELLRRVEMVNINTASAERVSQLPGIGNLLAERIVAYREQHGSFDTIDQLLHVEGIGEGKLEAIRSEIYVERAG